MHRAIDSLPEYSCKSRLENRRTLIIISARIEDIFAPEKITKSTMMVSLQINDTILPNLFIMMAINPAITET